MMKELFLLKLGEIVLKGQNRRVFEDIPIISSVKEYPSFLSISAILIAVSGCFSPIIRATHRIELFFFILQSVLNPSGYISVSVKYPHFNILFLNRPNRLYS